MPRTVPGWVRSWRIDRWLPPLVAAGIVVLAWQIVAEHQSAVVPSVAAVVRQFADQPGNFVANGWTTLREALVGCAASFVLATALAIAMHHVKMLERALMPLAVVLNVTPVMAIAPGLILAFGFGELPKYLVTGVVTFFPFLVNALVGMRSVDPGAREVFVSLNASQGELFWHLELPSSLPYLFAAARVCLPLSIVGAVVAEFVVGGNDLGLGSLIATSYNTSDLPPVYAAVLVLALIGVVLTVLVGAAEHRFLAWHASQRVRDRIVV